MLLNGEYFVESRTEPLFHMRSPEIEEQVYLNWPSLRLFLFRRPVSVQMALLVVLTGVSFWRTPGKGYDDGVVWFLDTNPYTAAGTERAPGVFRVVFEEKAACVAACWQQATHFGETTRCPSLSAFGYARFVPPFATRAGQIDLLSVTARTRR
ncbi:MAG: hypothetical protein KGO50_11455 [Myxococcales bacterium]|nr:hypothetical protein [Myxococcales bacterium]